MKTMKMKGTNVKTNVAGTSLPKKQPPIPGRAPTMPEGRMKKSEGKSVGMPHHTGGHAGNVNGGLHKYFNDGVVSGGKGTSIGDAIGPVRQNPGGTFSALRSHGFEPTADQRSVMSRWGQRRARMGKTGPWNARVARNQTGEQMRERYAAKKARGGF